MTTNTQIGPLSFAPWFFVSFLPYRLSNQRLLLNEAFFGALEKSMAGSMVGKTQAFPFMVLLFFLIKPWWVFDIGPTPSQGF
jgi:hypothetical protein